MSAKRGKADWPRVWTCLAVAGLLVPLVACSQAQVGAELAKHANGALDGGLALAEPLPQQAQQQAGISPYLQPAPDVFEATGIAQWDGKRTLQGVWVAHPLATTARRVRVFNTGNGQAVDGALFKRDAALGGASVLVSSEAAQRLGIEPGGSAELRIVAVTPIKQTEPAQPSAAEVAEDSTATPAAPAAPVTAAAPLTTTAPAADPAPEPAAPPVQATAQPEPKAKPPSEAASAPVTSEPPKAPTAKEAELEETAPVEKPVEKAAAPEPSDTVGDFKWERAPTEAAAPNKPIAPAAAAAQSTPQAPPEPVAQSTPNTGALKLPFVQAGVFGVAENAARLISKLESAGIAAEGKPVSGSKRQLTRVIAGPFQTVADRDAAQAKIREMGLPDAVPVRR